MGRVASKGPLSRTGFRPLIVRRAAASTPTCGSARYLRAVAAPRKCGPTLLPRVVDQHFLRGLQVAVVELVDRPEQAAGDQVEVARVADGLIVVAERCGEDLRLAVVR